MRDLCGDIDRTRAPLKCVKEIGKAFPVPSKAVGEHDARNLLDALHQVHKCRTVLWPDRGKTNAAVAKHCRSHTVPAGGREQRIPHRLPVVMGMHVDPAGRNQKARGVEVAPRRPCFATNLRNLPANDRHVATEGRLAGSVNDAATANNNVIHESQSNCAAEAWMIGAHCASSVLMKLEALSGVEPGVASIPASCKRLNP